MKKIHDWLSHEFDGGTIEGELRELFLDLVDVLRNNDLLRADFNKYKTHIFSLFCQDVFRHSK